MAIPGGFIVLFWSKNEYLFLLLGLEPSGTTIDNPLKIFHFIMSGSDHPIQCFSREVPAPSAFTMFYKVNQCLFLSSVSLSYMLGGRGEQCAQTNLKFYLQLIKCLKKWNLFPNFVRLDFGATIRNFVEGVALLLAP